MTRRDEMQVFLPDAPPPSERARSDAIAAALQRFDAARSEGNQGNENDVRLMHETARAPRPSRRRTIMSSLNLSSRPDATSPRRLLHTTQARALIAASVVALVAGSSVWVALDSPTAPKITAPAPKEATPPAPVTADAIVKPQPEVRSDVRAKVATIEQEARREGAPLRLNASPATSAAPPVPGRADQRAYALPQASKFAPPRSQLAIVPEQTLPAEPAGRDQFAGVQQNGFKEVREAAVSTFSIDVDTASYSFMRASLNRNVLPQPAAVRTEELINYFPYDYAAPASSSEPFRTTVSVFPSPWTEGRKIVQIGIKGYALPATTRPRANLVFLIDTSGSMNAPNRLPLVKQSLSLLLDQLDPKDRVSIVTYAGGAGTALEPTAVSEKTKIVGVIDNLGAGGSTAGAEGIRQAYSLAERNFDPKGVNRIVLATDGDFNVGITNRGELQGFIERQRGKGIFLSILGFGMGNYNDALMQALAQNGNGTAAYIDTIGEARKVLVEEAKSTLFPIAKDVKIQVEFNPSTVSEYRLIGYETRLLNKDDFNNDKVDAGEVGSGQTVTALYEIVPAGGPRTVDQSRYAAPATSAVPGTAAEYAFVKIRYKLPNSETSSLMSTPVNRSVEVSRIEDASIEARFATAVAAFGEILRGGRHTGTFGYDDVVKLATGARGEDPFGYRSEFLQHVRAAKTASAAQPR